MTPRIVTYLVLTLASTLALAGNLPDDLHALQQQWAVTQYETADEAKEKAFEDLVANAEQLVKDYPGKAEPLVWKGIILSTFAGYKGGLSALGLAKDARKAFDASLKLDDKALDGSAHTSIGTLYYKVPGWPFGFGNEEKAEMHLREGLRLNPQGIDPNYFFAEFLLDQGEPERARAYYEKALQAPPRPDRPLADKGRRHEVEVRLSELGAR
ncbi:tetratricopeptide repeat protein [Marinobacter caseinilyticus]|uniref:tetratricopeptide repeat protein n=1 Tax=Marinobacter caseinilyticus TaxID=2692195 RepID=UPI001408ED3C|nr:hypothetical protein [Marinobacter caseinilyticus]